MKRKTENPLFLNSWKFSGNIQNVDPKLVFSNWIKKDLKSKIKNVSSYLNGNFNIITDKNFYVKSLNFLSTSIVETQYPFLSDHLEYILCNIKAQSWASVPPAPANTRKT